MEKYKMQLRMSLDKADKKYQSKKAKVFRLIIGQCVPAMKHKIEGATKYPALMEASDVSGLLQFMKELVYSTHSTQPHLRQVIFFFLLGVACAKLDVIGTPSFMASKRLFLSVRCGGC
jgi:hypothetical protein